MAYTDDHGRTWSPRRYNVPVREFAYDRENVYGGSLRFFWNVGRPLILDAAALLVLHKVGAMGAGFFAQSEGAFLKSTNILVERDPEKLTFETLPEGDVGLRTPPGGGRVAEEQSVVRLSDGSLCCVYPALVEEGGQFYVTETQKSVGRVHEIPRALIEGLFNQFDNRRVTSNGLVLSVLEPMPREVAMPRLPEFHQRDPRAEDQRGRDLRAGFTLELRLRFEEGPAASPAVIPRTRPSDLHEPPPARAGEGPLALTEATAWDTNAALVDTRAEDGQGVLVVATEAGTIRLTMNDGRQEVSWASDHGAMGAGGWQHVVIIVDGGPKIIRFVVNGVLGDGGEERQFGWGRFSPTLRAPNGTAILRLAPAVRGVHLYNRALSTSEAVGAFRAGPP